ncbi:MAG: GDSL-type esterase/lipase family protein [Thermoanaerobaculia bacterium]
MTRSLVLALTLVAASLPTAARGQAATVYLAFGDSITQGTGAIPNAPGYPARLERILNNQGGNVRVENHGRGGETTVAGLSRIDGVLAGGGDVLLLMEGTNDVGAGISRETTLQNLNQMAGKAGNRGMSTIHATVIPRHPRASPDADNRLTTLLNYGIRDLVRTRSARSLVDPFEVFLAQANLFRDFYADNPGDRTGHPNGEGYELMAGAFADVILERDTVPPVPLRVQPANGATNVSRDVTIIVDIADLGTGVDAASVQLLLNGEEVQTQAQTGNRLLSLRHAPPQRLLGVYEVSYRASDLATPANSITKLVSRFQTEGTRFIRGDLNQDGQVDGQDLVIMGWRFGGRRGIDSRYFAGFDFNNDGVLDGEDLAVIALNFGKRSF